MAEGINLLLTANSPKVVNQLCEQLHLTLLKILSISNVKV